MGPTPELLPPGQAHQSRSEAGSHSAGLDDGKERDLCGPHRSPRGPVRSWSITGLFLKLQTLDSPASLTAPVPGLPGRERLQFGDSKE